MGWRRSWFPRFVTTPPSCGCLDAADRGRRLRLIRGLCKSGRRASIDGFLDDAATPGIGNGWIFFRTGRHPVRRHAEAFSAAASNEHWRRLARHHPGLPPWLTRTADAAEELDAPAP